MRTVLAARGEDREGVNCCDVRDPDAGACPIHGRISGPASGDDAQPTTPHPSFFRARVATRGAVPRRKGAGHSDTRMQHPAL